MGQVHIKEDFVDLEVSDDIYDRLPMKNSRASDDVWEHQRTDYSGTISIRASTVMRLAAQVFEELAQRDDSSRMKEALVPVVVTALRDVLAATSRVR